jgi:hypothetical protein
LIGQRFDRRGVKTFGSTVDREMAGKLSDDGLSCTGGCCDKDSSPRFEGLARINLKIIKGKFELAFKISECLFCLLGTLF